MWRAQTVTSTVESDINVPRVGPCTTSNDRQIPLGVHNRTEMVAWAVGMGKLQKKKNCSCSNILHKAATVLFHALHPRALIESSALAVLEASEHVQVADLSRRTRGAALPCAASTRPPMKTQGEVWHLVRTGSLSLPAPLIFCPQGRTESSTLPFASRASWDLASAPPLPAPRPSLRFSFPTTSSQLSTRFEDPPPAKHPPHYRLICPSLSWCIALAIQRHDSFPLYAVFMSCNVCICCHIISAASEDKALNQDTHMWAWSQNVKSGRKS